MIILGKITVIALLALATATPAAVMLTIGQPQPAGQPSQTTVTAQTLQPAASGSQLQLTGDSRDLQTTAGMDSLQPAAASIR